MIMAHPRLIEFLNTNIATLSDEEYKICILIAAGFKPQEMATIMITSKQNISSIRSRLYKKTFKEEKGTSREFDRFIRELL